MSKVRKILSWSLRDFLTGLGDDANLDSEFFNSATGWSPFQASYPGLLSIVSRPTEIDSGQTKIDTAILAMVPHSSGFIYALATNGDVYKFASSVTAASGVTVLRSDNSFTGSDGLAFYQPQGGTEYMYYWNGTQIGRWDVSGSYPTGWTDNWVTGLQSTTNRPTCSFGGDIYYGNKDRVGKIYNVSGTATNNNNVLDIESNYTIRSIIEDGYYLIIAADNGVNMKIYFWDSFSPSWNKEYTIPSGDSITAMQKVGGDIYAVTDVGLFEFSFNRSPIKVRYNIDSPSTGRSKSIGVINETIIFGGSSSSGPLQMYGSYKGGLPKAYFKPFRIPTTLDGAIDSIFVVDEYTVFVAANNRLFKFTASSYGIGDDLTADFKTRFVDLGDTYRITRVNIIAGAITWGDSVFTVKLYKDGDYSTAHTFDMETPTGSEVDQVQKYSFFPPLTTPGASGSDGFITDYLALRFYISEADSPQAYIFIKRIDIYGEPADYSHTKIY